MYNCVIFDWDGTLMDSVPRIVYSMQRAASDINIDVPTEASVKDIIGLSMNQAFEVLFGKQLSVYKDPLKDQYTKYFLGEDAPEANMFPGAVELLQRLVDQKVVLAVATGKTRRGLARVLTATKTEALFTATMTACDAKSKPSPEMIQNILSITGGEASRAIMVGDTVHDITMAHNANVAAIGISHGAHQQGRLNTAKPLCTVANIHQLSDQLSRLIS